jgi:hypothetical protein
VVTRKLAQHLDHIYVGRIWKTSDHPTAAIIVKHNINKIWLQQSYIHQYD